MLSAAIGSRQRLLQVCERQVWGGNRWMWAECGTCKRRSSDKQRAAPSSTHQLAGRQSLNVGVGEERTASRRKLLARERGQSDNLLTEG